jgi:integrase/recombinase XerD
MFLGMGVFIGPRRGATMQREQLENIAQRYLRRCDAESTRVAYGREMRRFLDWLPGDLGDDLLLDYRDHLRDRGLAPPTVRWRLTVARAFLRFAEGEGCTTAISDIQLPKGQRGFVPRVLNRAELKRLLDAPDRRTWQGARDAAILACLGLGGLRAGEVCTLQSDDVQIDRHEIVLRVHGKGGKVRVVTLALPAAMPVRSWLRHRTNRGCLTGPLFDRTQAARTAPLDVHALRYIVRKHATDTGLGSVNPHVLRHTEATLSIKRGVPLHAVQARMGHASLMTTAAYLHLTT